MASQIIAEYKQALINGNLGDEYINDNQDAKVIRINTCSKKTGALYLDADHFNACTIDFIRKMKKAKNSYTDPRFNYQILNAHNIIYLDGDWTDDAGKSDKENQDVCTSIAVEDMKLAIVFLEKNHINIEHRHIWVPTTFPVNNGTAKMGYHSFIICEENIDSDMRKSFLDYLKTNCTYGESVLDESPVKTTQSLLPYATKIGDGKKLSRSYYLASQMIKFDLNCNHYANPAIQNISSSGDGEQLDLGIGIEQIRCDDLSGSDEEEQAVETEQSDEEPVPLKEDPLIAEMTKRKDNITADNEQIERPVKCTVKRVVKEEPIDHQWDDAVNKAYKAAVNDFKEKNWTFRYGPSNQILFEFLNSLRYLHPRHRFFKMLSENDSRVKRIFPAVMRYMYVNYTVDKEGLATMDVGTMSHLMVRLMTPLVDIAFRHFKHDGKIRDIEGEIRQNVSYWFQKYGIDGMFNPATADDKRCNLLQVYRDWLKNGRGDKRKREAWLDDCSSVYDINDRLCWLLYQV